MPTFNPEPRTPFGKRIREERERAQMTQKEVGDLIQIPPAYLSQLELGYEPPTPKLIASLSEVYGIDADELYALANRAPADIIEKLSGNLSIIKKVRRCLGVDQSGTKDHGHGPE